MRESEIVDWLNFRLTEIRAEEDRLQEVIANLKAEGRGLQLSLAHMTNRAAIPARIPVPTAQVTTYGEDISANPDTVGLTPTQRQESSLDEGVPDGPLEGWAGLSITDAVHKLLAGEQGMRSPQDILELLREVGIELEDTTAVRSALSHLKRRDQAYSVRRGAWIVKGSPADKSFKADDIFDDIDEDDTPVDPPYTGTPTAHAVGVPEGVTPTDREGGALHPVGAG